MIGTASWLYVVQPLSQEVVVLYIVAERSIMVEVIVAVAESFVEECRKFWLAFIVFFEVYFRWGRIRSNSMIVLGPPLLSPPLAAAALSRTIASNFTLSWWRRRWRCPWWGWCSCCWYVGRDRVFATIKVRFLHRREKLFGANATACCWFTTTVLVTIAAATTGRDCFETIIAFVLG